MTLRPGAVGAVLAERTRAWCKLVRIDASNARHFVGVAQRRRGPPLFLRNGWCP